MKRMIREAIDEINAETSRVVGEAIIASEERMNEKIDNLGKSSAETMTVIIEAIQETNARINQR